MVTYVHHRHCEVSAISVLLKYNDTIHGAVHSWELVVAVPIQMTAKSILYQPCTYIIPPG